jgi:hypothetical protein
MGYIDRGEEYHQSPPTDLRIGQGAGGEQQAARTSGQSCKYLDIIFPPRISNRYVTR